MKGETFRKQRDGRVIVPRTINQYGPPLEGLTRLAVGPGLGKQMMAGLIPMLRLLGVQAAVGKAGPDGITAADWSDPDNITLGEGFVTVYVETSGGILKPRGKLEPLRNPFEGTVAAGHKPLFLVKVPGIVDGVWYLVTFQCP